jgi:hypothetical protein
MAKIERTWNTMTKIERTTHNGSQNTTQYTEDP